MSKTFAVNRLDVAAFAQAGGVLSGAEPVRNYGRLTRDLRMPAPEVSVTWRAGGELRAAADGSVRPALHLEVDFDAPMTCQRCMGEVLTPIHIDRHLVFVPDEATAAALDDDSEDDVLELTPALNLHQLIEDELLMALPLVPMHEQCPVELKLSAQGVDFDAEDSEKPKPFAALAALKARKSS